MLDQLEHVIWVTGVQKLVNNTIIFRLTLSSNPVIVISVRNFYRVYMATLDSHLELEIMHFENFKLYIPGYNEWCSKTVHQLLHMGAIQVSTAFEKALANVGGFTALSESGRDGSDDSDAKLVSARYHHSNTLYDGYVSNTAGKIGKLRVQLYERNHNKFYYFIIPKVAHSTVKYLEIPFDLLGNPKRKNRWWNYEVNSFEELAKG